MKQYTISVNKGYGYQISVSRNGVSVIINGFRIAVFKNMNTGKWSSGAWANVWRKTKEALPRAETLVYFKALSFTA